MKKTLFVILIGCLNTAVAAETQDKSNIIPKANLAASTDEQEATIQSSIILTDTPTQLPVYAVITPSYNQPSVNPFTQQTTSYNSTSMPAQQNVQARFNNIKAANQRIFNEKKEAARLIEEQRLEAERELQKAAKEEQDRKHNMAVYQQVIIPSLQSLVQQSQQQQEVEEESPPPKAKVSPLPKAIHTVGLPPPGWGERTISVSQDTPSQTEPRVEPIIGPPPRKKCSGGNPIGGFVIPTC